MTAELEPTLLAGVLRANDREEEDRGLDDEDCPTVAKRQKAVEKHK
jgi:hypothetical protein